MHGISGLGTWEKCSQSVSGANSKDDGPDNSISSKYTGGPECRLYIDESTRRVDERVVIGCSHEPCLLVSLLMWRHGTPWSSVALKYRRKNQTAIERSLASRQGQAGLNNIPNNTAASHSACCSHSPYALTCVHNVNRSPSTLFTRPTLSLTRQGSYQSNCCTHCCKKHDIFLLLQLNCCCCIDLSIHYMYNTRNS